MTDHVLTVTEDRIVKITFNRLDKKNALTHAMYDAAAKAISEADQNDDVRAIMITGTGDVFTAGNDLIDFQQSGGLEGVRPVQKFLAAMVETNKPVVAAVNGVGVGIGLTMLLHSDLVYMAKSAVISAPFVDLALVPEFASSLLLPNRIGHAKAAEIFMLGKKVTAQEALELGIANAVCDDAELLEVATKAAIKLTEKAPQALQKTKMLMRGDKQILADRMEQEGEHFGEQLKSPEVMEAIMAFMQKRKPNFG